MVRFGRHFVRVKEIKSFEKRLHRFVVDNPGSLHEEHETLYRYALRVAQISHFKNEEGKDIELGPQIDPFRRWILETLIDTFPESGKADLTALRELAPILQIRTEQIRKEICETHINDFTQDAFDQEIIHKKLVIVLGGGGGSGLLHLGMFSLLADRGYIPELLVGSSMGAILGMIRVMKRDYDPVATALTLPKQFDYGSIFKPFTGYSRYGLPGAFHLNLLRTSKEIFHAGFGNSMPRFSDLPIKFEVVATGIRKGFSLDEQKYEKLSTGNTPLSARKRMQLFFNAVRQLNKNSRLLTQVVFGREDTKNFPIIEATGFSSSVPGLLNYDIFHDDPDTIGPLDEMFERNELLRLCDGGVVNNVPSRVAWESVQLGSIGTRNSHIVGFDVFAPIATSRNMLWIPAQQFARSGVLSNIPYSDQHIVYQNTPSPLQIFVNSYTKLKTIVESSREQLEPHMKYIDAALAPLPIERCFPNVST